MAIYLAYSVIIIVGFDFPFYYETVLFERISSKNYKPFLQSNLSYYNFGCWGSEPYALLWILDAFEISVIEEKEENLNNPKEMFDVLKKKFPKALMGRDIKFITADMLHLTEADLPSDHFDLAYCEDTLYFMQDNDQDILGALNVMKRVIKPGGWIIAWEPKYKADFEWTEAKLCDDITIPSRTQLSEAQDMSKLFKAKGLIRDQLPDAPDWSYCYRKPL